MSDPVRVCTFTLGGRHFALPVSEIREVVRGLAITPVPLAAGAVRGLVNLRGQIATALDLRRRLDLPPRAPGHDEVNVVVDSAEGAVCLAVDDVGDVVEVPAEAFDRPPETLRPSLREVVKAVCTLPEGLVLLLDTARAVEAHHGRRPADGAPTLHA